MLLESSLSTSLTLIERVKQQDSESWRRLATIYGPVVYQWSRQAGLQSHDAADVVQLVFQTVATSITQFHHEEPAGNFRGWLWTVFRSRLNDFYRQGRKRPATPGAAWEEQIPDPRNLEPGDSLVEENERLLVMRQALTVVRDDFKESTWQAFWRVAALGEPPSEVARQLGMTPAAVCMCRSRVLRRLRETVGGLGLLPDEPASP
jgi:RNA polymerase sigma-70 factor (ECF subfamily)